MKKFHGWKQKKIFFIFLGKRGYYCDRNYIFNMDIIKDLIKRAKNPEDILRGLHEDKITYLLVNYPLFEKWMKDNFPEEKQIMTQHFFKSFTKLIYGKNGFGVNVLLSEPDKMN